MRTSIALWTAGLLVSGLSHANELIYKSIDSDGNAVFSDQPAPEATIVKSSPLNIMDSSESLSADGPEPAQTVPASTPDTDTVSSAEADSDIAPVSSVSTVNGNPENLENPEIQATDTLPSESDPELLSVTEVAIVSPAHEETLIDPEGSINVNIQTSPAPSLPLGFMAQIRLDGKLVASGWNSTLPIDIPERGTHRLQVIIVDSEGTQQAVSSEAEIHIKHSTVTSSVSQ